MMHVRNEGVRERLRWLCVLPAGNSAAQQPYAIMRSPQFNRTISNAFEVHFSWVGNGSSTKVRIFCHDKHGGLVTLVHNSLLKQTVRSAGLQFISVAS